MATKYYASLTGPLLGVYYPMPAELNDETECRLALNSSKLKGLWCSVYEYQEVKKQGLKYGGLILDDSFARKLDYDTHVVRMRGNTESVFA
jgi:hypothetical protein